MHDVTLVNIFISLRTTGMCHLKIRFNFICSEKQLINLFAPSQNNFLFYVHFTTV